jgi:hypothetical protein
MAAVHDPQYPNPPELSPEEVARRRASARRWGLAIATLCIALAVVTLVVLLSFERG